MNRDKLPSHLKMEEKMFQAEGTGGQEVGTDLESAVDCICALKFICRNLIPSDGRWGWGL